jgi:hypothetical protein
MAPLSLVLPNWLDQVPGIDFSPEKELLRDLETWAATNGWQISDGRELPHELRKRTDVLLDDPVKHRRLRVAVLPKSSNNSGSIRLDASNLRTLELVYQPTKRRWRLEVGSVPLTDDILQQGWSWFTDLAFKP